tara:strand:+ start:1547 stop:2164 length:618 start_codon:yes stop_codon:yes gene_type:complete
MTETRNYPNAIIPTDPADANFESDFRSNTQSLMTATKSVDSELSLARVSNNSGAQFQSLASRLDNIEADAQAGAIATFWKQADSTNFPQNATWVVGENYFDIYGDQTSVFVTDLALKMVQLTSEPDVVVYGYVQSSNYVSYNPYTRVFVVSDNIGTQLVISDTNTEIYYSAQQGENIPLIKLNNLSDEVQTELKGQNVALTMAFS